MSVTAWLVLPFALITLTQCAAVAMWAWRHAPKAPDEVTTARGFRFRRVGVRPFYTYRKVN